MILTVVPQQALNRLWPTQVTQSPESRRSRITSTGLRHCLHTLKALVDVDSVALPRSDDQRAVLTQAVATQTAQHHAPSVYHANGVGLSLNRTCREPADEALTGVDTTSTAVESRADILMIPNAQGGCDQLLQGPNVQKESTTAQEEETVYSAENGTQETMEMNLFYIPKRLNMKYRPFLEATLEDFARGTLHVLKCRLCPGADFSTWDDFVRHCKTTEAHPLKIFFCNRCGDFFARRDSLRRHGKNPPLECLGIASREAEDKRNETQRRHEEFKKSLGHYLETTEGTWTPFSQIIKEKYPDSSKRGSRQQSRLQIPKSKSL